MVTITIPEVPGYGLGENTSATVTINEGVCDRTAKVRTAILDKLSGISDCAQVTDTDLSGITGALDLTGQSMTELQARDFRGLTGLQQLRLSDNSLASLPEGVFDGLTSLEQLRLSNNSLASLHEDVFDGLTGLQELRLSNNSLTSLHEDVFDGLTGLQELRLSNNSLASLHEDVFNGLTGLQDLRLINISLASLPEGMFDGLTGLTTLRMQSNPGSPFTLRAELEQTVANQVTVTVDEGAPFDMTTTLSVEGGTLSNSSVVISAGNSESPAITVTPSGDAPVLVTVTAATFPGSGVSYNGIQTGVGTANQAPVANAGSDQTVNPGATVTLDASGSSDPDTDDTLSYSWTQTAGTTVTLSSATVSMPTFTAPSSSDVLTFNVTVMDGRGGSDSDTVDITINSPPVADAGSDQTVNTGVTVTLDASGSNDPDTGDTLSYDWMQTAGTTVTLSSATAVNPTFTATSTPATLTFEVTVTDDRGGSDSDTVDVKINTPPEADAGPDQTVNPGATVTLDASGSSDPDTGDTLGYNWTQTAGTTVTLSSATASSPTFIAPSSAEVLTFEITVADGRGGSDSETVDVTINSPPVANAGPDQTVDSGVTVTLDGSGSSDPDTDDTLSYDWTQTVGTTITLGSTTAVSPTFTAPNVSEALTFELTVTDNHGASATDDVIITINAFTPQDVTFSTPGSYTFNVGRANRVYVSGRGADGGTGGRQGYKGADRSYANSLTPIQDPESRPRGGSGGTGGLGADGSDGRAGRFVTSFDSFNGVWNATMVGGRGGGGEAGTAGKSSTVADSSQILYSANGGRGRDGGGSNGGVAVLTGSTSTELANGTYAGEEPEEMAFTVVEGTVLTVNVGTVGQLGHGGGGGENASLSGGSGSSAASGADGIDGATSGWIHIRTARSSLGFDSFDDTGLTMEVLALIEVGSEAGTGTANPAALYTKAGFMNPDAVPASGFLVEGNLTLGNDSDITRIIYLDSVGSTDGVLRLNDLLDTENIGAYFNTGGAGNDLTLYIQTSKTNLRSAGVSGMLSGMISGTDWIDLNTPDAMDILLSELSDGDSLIIGLGRSSS